MRRMERRSFDGYRAQGWQQVTHQLGSRLARLGENMRVQLGADELAVVVKPFQQGR